MKEIAGTNAREGGGLTSSRRAAPSSIIAAAALVAVALVAVAIVTGCTSREGTSVTSGGDAVTQPIDSITVSGQGTIKAGPDEAVLTVTVETDAPDPQQALDANSKGMQSVLDRLKAEGLDDASLQTANVAVFPNRRWDEKTNKEVTESYRAQNSIQVILTDLARVGPVFAAATEAGAGTVSGPDWRLSDDGEAVSQALEKAYAAARAKAETLATAAGIKLGEVLSVQESGVTTPPVFYGERLAAADMTVKAPPVNPMDLEVIGSVTVTFRLER